MYNSVEEMKKGLESLYSFGQLHSWCDQLNQKIYDFMKNSKGQNSSYILSLLENSYIDPSASKEQLVLTLILLNKLGQENYKISEQLYQTLQRRLDINDQKFLRFHLFNNLRPLPDDITYDITSRPFLSFKRAISRGMKIQSVLSPFDPSVTALYLVIIFCRVDLNEQNRAMLSFLLSRIDADLPENVIRGIFSYLNKLNEIIDDLEKKGDQAFSDEYRYKGEAVGSEEKETAKKEVPVEEIEEYTERQKADLIKNTFPPEKEQQTGEIETMKKKAKSLEPSVEHNKTTINPPALKESNIEQDGDNIEHVKTDSNTVVSPEQEEKIPQTHKEKDINPMLIQSVKAEENNEQIENTPDTREPLKHEDSKDSNIVNKKGVNEGEPEKSEPGYIIRFNKNTENLRAIIENLDKGNAPAVEESDAEHVSSDLPKQQKQAVSLDKPEAKAPGVLNKKSEKRIKKRLLYIIAGMIALLLLIFFLKTDYRSEGENGTENVGHTSKEKRVQPIPSSELLKEESGNDVGFRIERGDEGYTWRVQSGESLWLLYQSAIATGETYSGENSYSVPQDVTWNEFLSDVLSLNPEDDQFTIIYPEQTIVLPDYKNAP